MGVEFHYPRDDKNAANSLHISKGENGALSNEKTEATLILDGIHRWCAFKECGLKKIEAIEWEEYPQDYEMNRIALLLEVATCNISHGDRLSPRDKKQVARNIATSDMECKWTEDAMAQTLGVGQ